VTRRLVQAALAEGLPAEPYWSLQEGLVYELTTGTCEVGEFRTALRKRQGTKASDVPGFLCEKGNFLQPGSAYRASQAALAERWGAETGHALPLALASLLRSNSAIPDEPRWIAFALEGKTCADVPELRALVTREAQPELLAPDTCVSCGQIKPVARLHDGVVSMGNVAPVLLSWDRGSIVTRKRARTDGKLETLDAGANLPTCLTCMWLYVQWLNKHTSYNYAAQQHSFVLGDERWFLSNNVGAGFVTNVVREDPLTLLWETLINWQTATKKRMPVKTKPDLEAIDRVMAQPRDPCYQMGFLYGVLEWATWVLGATCPPLADVAQAPALHLSALIIACRDGAERYTAPVADKGRPRLDARPISRIDVVRVKLAHVIWLATEHVTALRVEPILQHDRPAFALGYAHSLTHRGPRSEAILVDEENEIVINGNEPTPWAKRLAYALMDRGVRVELEWRVDYTRDAKPRHFRLDLAVLDAKLAVEVDGRLEGWRTRNHTSDSRKCAALLAQGWRVHRVPNKRLNRRDDIAEVADEVVAILATIRGASDGTAQG